MKQVRNLKFNWLQLDSNQNHLVHKQKHSTIWPNWPNDWAVCWILICQVHLTVCSCHVTYMFQTESTVYSCLNVKELLARSRRKIWNSSDCNWTWTQNHFVHKQTLNHLAKLAKWLSCAEYLSVWCIWLYVLAMSCRCFRVNPHFIVQLQSLKL